MGESNGLGLATILAGLALAVLTLEPIPDLAFLLQMTGVGLAAGTMVGLYFDLVKKVNLFGRTTAVGTAAGFTVGLLAVAIDRLL